MSGCALRRWGPGTPCTRPIDTPASKEMEAKLAAIRAEREKQDKLWDTEAEAKADETKKLKK
jgi:hypothetical protein